MDICRVRIALIFPIVVLNLVVVACTSGAQESDVVREMPKTLKVSSGRSIRGLMLCHTVGDEVVLGLNVKSTDPSAQVEVM